MKTISEQNMPTDTVPISAVIPAFNSAGTIGRAVESVLGQTCRPAEVIVVDDGSTDETADVVRHYDGQVRLLQQKNSGPAAARNRGIENSRHAWVALLDADDAWLPEKLQRQLPLLARDVALVHCYTVNDTEKFQGELNFARLWAHNYIGTSTVILNRQLTLAVGGFREDRALMGAEDYHLWLRLAATGRRIVTLRQELSLYEPPPQSLSGQTERVIQAELLNTTLIAQQFELCPEVLAQKQVTIHEEYGRALFWNRQLRLARASFACAWQARRSRTVAAWWLATFLPSPVLNLKRRLARLRSSWQPDFEGMAFSK